MEEHFEPLVDYEFTAELEDFLDSIQTKWVAKNTSRSSTLAMIRGPAQRWLESARTHEKLDAIDPKTSARSCLEPPKKESIAKRFLFE